MKTIAQIIEAALNELFERGVIDLPPEEMESFEAECEMEYDTSKNGVSVVILCGWYVFVWWMNGTLEAYYSMSATFVPCSGCTAPTPENELLNGVCSSCEWQATRKSVG
jgi:hypothetical protein